VTESSTATRPVILETRDLCRYFGGIKAVQNISLKVEKGRITSLIGPNGAGKTTVFNAITGVFPPTLGAVELSPKGGAKTELGGLRTDQICALGVARTFQNIRLFPDMPVVDNVKLGMHCRTQAGVLGSILRLPGMQKEEDDIHAAALRYLDFVGLGTVAHELATNLPYGDQRLLEIARALATQPEVILLDEPAAGMNPTETESLMSLIRKICESGGTVFLIEHDMKLVMEISDYIYVMDHGEMICQGEPDLVKNDPKVIEAYLGAEEDDDA
jgi:branched-chain amino acid transport system ATP-binding protein